MANKLIPTKINKYNIYNDAERMLGTGDEVSLPDFETASETISGAGFLGEVADPTPGYFNDLSMDIPIRVADEEGIAMLDSTKTQKLTLRGAQQVRTPEGDIEYRQMRVVLRGIGTKYSPGKVKAGSPMDGSVSLSITYIMIEVGGTVLLELDKWNEVFKVLGKDMIGTIKEMC